MAEDKRILKTKQTLKRTMISLLNQKPFEKISVSELCATAKVSRITYYNYYGDKTALIQDMINDYYAQSDRIYHELQQQCETEKQSEQGYKNLLECILLMANINQDFFRHLSMERNPAICSIFYIRIRESVEDYLHRHTEHIRPRYPENQVASLLCMGLLGALYEITQVDRPSAEIAGQLRAMYSDLIDSRLFENG